MGKNGLPVVFTRVLTFLTRKYSEEKIFNFYNILMIRGVSVILRQQPNRRLILNSISTTLQRMSVQATITENLTQELKPTHLEVLNESYMHNVPKGSETHFKVIVVSDVFKDKSLIQRHRMVNEVLKKELEEGVHALSIQAKTPEQWDSSGHKVSKSPPCLGGSAR